ncbi:lytic murein transglycosylase B [Rhodoferax sp.]|uniref:lytic murein transglycosylase B n=1 Tax=Rhodoferax sp. TaxID=50421 RepID=UPI002600665C|nr:lytic murein transglycosylase B [Rhodoferax sp.]
MPFHKTIVTLILIAACASSIGATSKKHAKSKAKAKPAAAATEGTPYGERADLMRLADDIAQRRNLDPAWVRATLAKARMLPSVVRAITPPAVGTPKNWALYRSRFVEPIRIRAGVKFWLANQETLARVEAQTGVPASIIVGIIGVETIYGQQLGNYRVMDALTTLALDFPDAHPRKVDRQAYFLTELESYLSLTHRTGTDPMALRGSYAGAMGWPQFMPSSWVKYGIDFDNDSRVDLFHSQADVIGSVANYFQAFKWKPGMATHYPVQFDMARLDMPTLMAPDILPTFSPAAMQDKGVILDPTALNHAGPLALVELQNGAEAPTYVAGTENFYAITRYNWSSYYAMAVIDLGQAVAQAIQAQTSVPK